MLTMGDLLQSQLYIPQEDPGAHVGYVGPTSHVVGFSFHHQWELWDAMSWDSRVWTIDIGVNNTPGNGR